MVGFVESSEQNFLKNLHFEISTTIESDLRSKEVDDMKNRALTNARSYDEFRNLVACASAGQKALSSKDVQRMLEVRKRRDDTPIRRLREYDQWRLKTQHGAACNDLLKRLKTFDQKARMNNSKNPTI